MLSLVLSTIAFFVAGYYFRRYLDDMGMPKGMTRNLLIFCLAFVVSSGVAYIVTWAAS
ncbi:MAG TPA: hypothetical protein VLV32_05745 [Burkholderiales bacterium]|nr:hypothetical protein [Burkholderiales bacterium]